MTDSLTEAALFELLSLECRVDPSGAITYSNRDGQLHRVYGPAVMHENGRREWWQNGLPHRLDGPAVVCTDGYRVWLQNGQRHRIDGPAVEYSGGSCAWYQNGLLHREDGPAIEYSDGGKSWYINGGELTEAEWQQAVASMETV